MTERSGLPRIAVLLTGGTIQSIGRDRLDLSAYMENRRRLPAEELLGRVGETADIAVIEAEQFRTVPSTAMAEPDWLDLLARIGELTQSGRAAGIVVTHGTNTLEETAFFLHLTLKTAAPVVFVGAMRPASAASGDGELNLINGVRVAVSPEAAGLGVLVVMNDRIHSARDVTKTSTYRVDAFDGRELGPLGFVEADGRVNFYHRPARPHTLQSEFAADSGPLLPKVALLVSYSGADGALVDAAAAGGAAGIVIAGTGAGGLSPGENAAADRAREAGIAVCLASRVGSGAVLQRPEHRLRGFVTAGNLVPWKARILLMLALARTRDPAAIQAMFDRY